MVFQRFYLHPCIQEMLSKDTSVTGYENLETNKPVWIILHVPSNEKQRFLLLLSIKQNLPGEQQYKK